MYIVFIKLFLKLIFLTAISSLSPAGFSGDNLLDQEKNPGKPREGNQIVTDSKKAPVIDSSIWTRSVYFIILGELYAQRGDFESAAIMFADAARLTHNHTLTKKALELSVKAKNQDLAISMMVFLLAIMQDDRLAINFIFNVLESEKDLQIVTPILAEILRLTPKPLISAIFITITDFFERHANKKDFFEAIITLASAFPDSADAIYLKAKAAEWTHQYESALTYCENALKISPNMGRAAVLKANILAREELEKAVNGLLNFVEKFPSQDYVRLALARMLFLQNELLLSRDQFALLSEKNPQNAHYAYSTGILSAEIKELNISDEYLKRALILDHHLKDVIRFKLGLINEEMGRINDAGTWYLAVETGADYIFARSRYALILNNQGKFEEAWSLLGTLMPQNPEQKMQLLQAKANLQKINGDYEKSYLILSEAYKEKPDDQDLLYEMALVSEKMDRIDLVEKHLLRLLKLNPEHAQAYNALGYTLADKTNRHEEALSYIELALALEPQDPYILDSMGWICFKMGNMECGKKYLQAAYKISPDPEIAAHLGELLWQDGFQEDAKKIWENSLNLNPGSEPLQNIIRKYID